MFITVDDVNVIITRNLLSCDQSKPARTINWKK